MREREREREEFESAVFLTHFYLNAGLRWDGDSTRADCGRAE